VKSLARILFVLAGTGILVVTSRAYRASARDFAPQRGTISKPQGADNIEGLTEVSFGSGTSLLRGWYIPSRNRAGIVLMHGTTSDRRQLLPEARILSRSGYGVLLFDLPGSGESSGQWTWGRVESAALSSALDWMTARSDLDPHRLGVLGFSAGASIAAVEAAGDPRARALLLEGIVVDLLCELRYEYGRYWLVSQLPAMLAPLVHGFRPDDLPVKRALPLLAPRPLLLVAGSADTSIRPGQTQEAFSLARMPKQIWLVPGAHHGDYSKVSQEYERRVTDFFDQALLLP